MIIVKISVLNQDFKMWTQIWIQFILADPDPKPMDRAQNSESFTFEKFENPSSGSKVSSLQSWGFFFQKVKIIWPISSLKIMVK